MGFFNADKCDWCGRPIPRGDFGDFAALGEQVINKGKNFCSKRCKTLYQQSHGQGSGGKDGGNKGSVVDAFNRFTATDAESKKIDVERRKEKEATRKDTLEMVVTTEVPDEPEQIYRTMETFVASFDRVRDSDDFKQISDAIQRKLDEAWHKLSKYNGVDEHQFYVTQGRQLIDTFKAEILKKRRQWPLLGLYAGLGLPVAALTATGIGIILAIPLAIFGVIIGRKIIFKRIS